MCWNHGYWIDTSNKSWNNILFTDDITLKYTFGKIGETRLMVMASLLIADEIHELNKKLETNIEKINSLEANIGSKDKELTDQKKESQEYIDISNDRLTDLLSRLSLVN